MTLCPSVDATEIFVRRVLGDKADKSGLLIADHCVRVMRLLPANTTREEQLVALLHDVIEDTDLTAASLLNLGYPLTVVNAVSLLTHDKGLYPDYLDYIRRIRFSDNAMAIRVKIADNADNSDPSRYFNLSPEDAIRFRERYSLARTILLS